MENEGTKHVPVSQAVASKATIEDDEDSLIAFVEAEEACPEKAGPFQDRLQSVHPSGATRND